MAVKWGAHYAPDDIDEVHELIAADSPRDAPRRARAEPARQSTRRPDAPHLPTVPLFHELMTLRGCSRACAVVYGVIAAFHALGHHPTVQQIAEATGRASSEKCNSTREMIAKLERLHMLRRVREAQNATRYELLGPTLGSGERAA